MTDFVAMMKDYARENYWNYSWDIVADQWSYDEVAAAIAGAKTRRGAIAKAWGKLQTIDARRRKSDRPVKPASLFEFLASIGGLKPCPDLTYILDGNRMVSRFGPLLRCTGRSLDSAREACVEAGYLQDTPWQGGLSVSTINELLELIAEEARGSKQYAMGEEHHALVYYEMEEPQ